jgi:hypothetical protein
MAVAARLKAPCPVATMGRKAVSPKILQRIDQYLISLSAAAFKHKSGISKNLATDLFALKGLQASTYPRVKALGSQE